MNTQASRSIAEISRRATHILYKEMGVVDTIRFLNQFSVGTGDYTRDRKNWLKDLSLEEMISEIKSRSK